MSKVESGTEDRTYHKLGSDTAKRQDVPRFFWKDNVEPVKKNRDYPSAVRKVKK